MRSQRKGLSANAVRYAKNRPLTALSWESGLSALNKALVGLRTVCYIVLTSASSGRNHVLANVQPGAHHLTQGDNGTLYHWMRSRPDKTDTGVHDWIIPEAAVCALSLMGRWAAGPLGRWAEAYEAMIVADRFTWQRP